MNIYRLKYTNKIDAISDLIIKKVINKDQENINGTESMVECEIINDGAHYNIMTTDTLVFESEVFPKNPKFKFAD
mgnify:CR=1 FL=1